MADHGPDNLTILVCTGSGCAAKQIILDENGVPRSIPYNAGKRFRPRYASVANFDDLATVLDSLAPLPQCFVIRGTGREDVAAQIRNDPDATVKRRMTGAGAAFEPAARQWLAIDLDAIPAPTGTDPITDPDDAIEYLIGLLPPEFHDARCWWQWTASQGFKPDTLNARIWFWLDRPVGDQELRRWAEHVNSTVGFRLIDSALFQPVQPHYTAGPIFNGVADPLSRRTGRRHGLDDEVSLVLPQAAERTRQRQTDGSQSYRDTCGVEGYLARMGDGDGLDGFYQPIKRAIASAVRLLGPYLDQEGLKAHIRAAIENAPKRPDRAADCVRYAGDEFLDPLIFTIVGWERESRGHADARSVTTSAPTYPLPVTDVTDVRARVRATVKHMLGEALAYWSFHDDYVLARALREAGLPVPGGNLRGLYRGTPTEIGLRADCGLGKSQVTRELTSIMLQERPGSKVIVATPTVDLAEKAASEARAIGLKAVAIRGRDQPVPGWTSSRDTDKAPRMCGDPDAVEDCKDAGIAIEKSACARVVDGVELRCSLFDSCRYQTQKSEAEHADVIYMAHQYLFYPKFGFIGDVSLVVIDESFWQAGLMGLGKARITLTCAGLQETRYFLARNGRVDDEAPNDWNTYAGRLASAISGNGEGWLTRSTIEAAGITKEIAEVAGDLALRLRVDPGITPGMDPRKRRRQSEAARETNQFSKKARATWNAIVEMFAAGRAATGNIHCGVIDRDQDGGEIFGARLLYRNDIHTDWHVPTLLLDATLREELIKPYFPWVIVHDTPTVAMPHVTVRQVVGAPVSAHKLIDDDYRRTKDKTTAANHQTAIHRFARMVARGRDQVLLVAQKKVETRLNAMGLPATVETTHFNATAGIDSWKVIDQLQTYGRTLPGLREVEFIAAAVTGQPVQLSDPDGWYQQVPGGIAMADGTTYRVTLDRHWHPVAEAIRWAICEGEVIQTIGRARGVNRTAADPCEIIIATDLPLPIAVHEVVPWEAPDRFDEMALCGAVLENAADMARAYPDLWENHEAAKKAKQRSGTNAYNDTYIKAFVPLLVGYRPVGAGQKDRRGWFDMTIISDPRAWLEERLGPLAKYEVMVAHEIIDAAAEPVS
jgi:putative DNA primase/helicase